VLLENRTLEGTADGAIALAYRRWKRPTVRGAGTLRTRIGVLEILAVDLVAVSAIGAADPRQAGYSFRRALLDDLAASTGLRHT
jgi:hypothetical protein